MCGAREMTQGNKIAELRTNGPTATVDGLSVDVPGPDGYRRILSAVTMSISAGEMVGLVGESGAGKSMTARALARLLPERARHSGSVKVDGTDVLQLRGPALRQYRARRVAVIFQDPRANVNPVRSIGDFMTQGLRFGSGMPRRDAEARALKLLDSVEVGGGARRMRQYPHELSGGMLQRVVIAAALMGNPDFLLADEPTTALDPTIQRQVMTIFDKLKQEHGVGILLVTHDLDLAMASCDFTYVMYAGEIVEAIESADFESSAYHPYTRALLKSRPHLYGPRGSLHAIRGYARPAHESVEGCRFADRCDLTRESCLSAHPSWIAKDPRVGFSCDVVDPDRGSSL